MGETISVIIPVHNTETYLLECLKSVSEQTYNNLEIILVDDGSNDTSGEICDYWGKKDSRVRVFHDSYKGVSVARNVGLNAATGEMIAFVDSDDIINPDMFFILHKVMKCTKSDICCCNLGKGTDTFEWADEEIRVKFYTSEQAFCTMMEETDVFAMVWNKLYRRDVLKGILFPPEKCHEDEFWIYHVIDRADRIASVNRKLYGYRQRNGSIMNSRYTLHRLDILEAREERLKLFEEKYPKLIKKGKCDLRFECIRAQQFSLLYLSGEERKKARNIIRQVIRRHPVKLTDCENLPFGRRFWYLTSSVMFLGTCYVRNWLRFGP